ncbi:GspH/FimT family pseudopilin [Pseudomonas sp. CCI3.2]|uniref:GspH/FimT family pseudopilin n=1 Tax=unclassified Pseudomonas TaxID=196821 RepID=UPI002AC9AB64|nr:MULTISPECIES: GspH/FimT family pseudopilin [unclassified Pseudomonas]MEB0076772.1 GspH/FimT family pseudopilin [Pseudomonas sp. MH10out]MEB0101905.1 GspH/FimT family pseudopilin [Pseudomonas sp. CCI3.2]MEB0131108.1 GspH/FimT family pseudopilin [Pseudomonas sp. CCI2.4]MEB0157097.1 GspH/FimT family pseudopilin [Pseudomonas sp. AH2 (2023)]MEB0167519.1 GspH/FimT family pseudopilin [Pseudomonas sp. CCC4.4]
MKQTGVGLIQLMAGLALIAVAAQLAVPGFGQLVESQRRTEVANQLTSALRSARTEAILRNTPVLVYAIDDNWSVGWRIMLEHKAAGGEYSEVLREHASGGKVPITGNFRGKPYVRFNGLGSALTSNGTLLVCDTQKPISHYQIVVAASGRVRLESDQAHPRPCR